METPKKIMSIKMFNTFRIIFDDKILTYEEIRSDKVIKLLVYLLTHRTHSVSSAEITDVLWQNEEIDNPAGALKNLVYRLRTLFKTEFGIGDCVVTGRGSYTWNSSIEVETDVDRFDQLVKELKRSNINENRKIALCQEVVELYTGIFMANVGADHWIIPMSTFYHSNYLSIVKGYCEILDEIGSYEEMEIVSQKAIQSDNLDEDLHVAFIKALIGQGKQKLAAEHYKNTVKMIYEILGTRPGDELQKVYQNLKIIINHQELDLQSIQKDLEEANNVMGPYLCEYGTFKDFYRLQARLAGRLGISVHVSLITIMPSHSLDEKSVAYLKLITKVMGNMEDILIQSLRVGDIVARYSSNQYVVLLPTCTFEDATNVMQRLLNKFYVGSRNSRTKVQYNLQELTLTDSRYQ